MLDDQETDEPLLVVLAQNGDRDALEALLRQFYRPLRAFITPLVGSSHVDDVLQEIALTTSSISAPCAIRQRFVPGPSGLASRRAFRSLKHEQR
jgi:hypothetical protein